MQGHHLLALDLIVSPFVNLCTVTRMRLIYLRLVVAGAIALNVCIVPVLGITRASDLPANTGAYT